MMAGVVGINPLPLTFRELVLMYDAKLLHDWDQTHLLGTHLGNIPVILQNMMSKRKARPRSYLDNHHLRQNKSTGMKLTPSNLHLLKGMADDGRRAAKKHTST